MAVPPWALVTLSFRELGRGMDKAGAYVDRLMPNSAELAKQAAMSYLFNLPVDGALKKDGWAVIFQLDPAATQTDNERAFILCTADAAAMKTALIGAYGVPKEEAGILTFTLPQPVPQPDKILAVKLAGGKVLAAPSVPFLAKLEDYLASNPGGPFGKLAADATPPDAVLTLKISALKRDFGGMLETSLAEAARLAAPGAAEAARLNARLSDWLESFWELDAIEARLEVDASGARASLEILAMPEPQSELAEIFALPATPTSGQLLSLLPGDAACLATWNMNGTQLVDWLSDEFENHNQAGQKEAEAVRKLLSFLSLASGEGALAVSGSGSTGGAFLLALQAQDPAKAAPSLAAVFEALGSLLAAANSPHVQLKALPAEDRAGIALQRYQAAGPVEVSQAWSGLMGWPLGLQYALSNDTVLLSTGRQGLDALKQALSDVKTLKGRQDAGAPNAGAPKGIFPGLAAGTFALVLVHPVRLARLGLATLPPESLAAAAEITAGIPDVPLAISMRQDKNVVALRLELPAAVPQAAYTLAHRLRSVNASHATPAP
ncbi:MAG: hypothetical protein ABSE73_30370 [Planctomycetota bacterium]